MTSKHGLLLRVSLFLKGLRHGRLTSPNWNWLKFSMLFTPSCSVCSSLPALSDPYCPLMNDHSVVNTFTKISSNNSTVIVGCAQIFLRSNCNVFELAFVFLCRGNEMKNDKLILMMEKYYHLDHFWSTARQQANYFIQFSLTKSL